MNTPHPIRFKGSALARFILKLLGWRVEFQGLPALQGMIVVYPHTSNWDFPIGLLAKWAIGIPAHFWAKDSLFKFPLIGRWMRWVGGIAIDRSAPQGMVASVVDVYARHRPKTSCCGWPWPPRARAASRLAGKVVFTRWLWAPRCRWRWCALTGGDAHCLLWTL